MKNLEIECILQEIIKMTDNDSDALKELPSYDKLIADISNNYSNEELLALQYLCEELGRNIEYDIIRKKSTKEFRIGIENTKDDRKNNIKIVVYSNTVLNLPNKKEYLGTDRLNNETVIIPFHKNKYETIKPIYEELDSICYNYNIANKEEAEFKIEEYTGMKRQI